MLIQSNLHTKCFTYTLKAGTKYSVFYGCLFPVSLFAPTTRPLAAVSNNIMHPIHDMFNDRLLRL